MTARRDAAKRRVRRIDQKRGRRRGEQALRVAALREQEPRESERQRRLADATRPGQQPGMRQPAGAIRVEQRRLSPLLPDQRRVFARLRRRGFRSPAFGLVLVVDIVGHGR